MANTSFRVQFSDLGLTTDPLDVIVSGETRLPTGAIVKTSGSDRAALLGDPSGLSTVSNANISCGVTDFTDTFCISASDKDNVNPSQTISQHDDASGDIVRMFDPGNNTLIRSASVIAIAGGIRLTPNESGFDNFISVTLIFGAEVKAFSVGGAWTQDTDRVVAHGLTGKPNAGITIGASAYQGSQISSSHSHGVFADIGVIKQVSASQRSSNNVSPATVWLRVADTRIHSHQLNSGVTLWQVELSANDASNTTFTMRDADAISPSLIGLLFYMDDAGADVAILDTPISNAVDWVYSGLSIVPQYFYAITSPSEDVNSVPTTLNRNGSLGVAEWDGVLTGDEGQEISIQFSSEVGVTPNNTSSFFINLIYNSGHTGFPIIEASNPIFQQGGFIIDSPNILTTPTQIRKWPVLGIEELGAVTPAATLSNAGTQNVGASQAQGTVETDTLNGIMYGVVTQVSGSPSHQQIKDGQNNIGDPADSAAQSSVSVSPTILDFFGLEINTTYWAHFTQESSGGTPAVSTINSPSFQTSAANQAPVIVGPIPDQTVVLGQSYNFDISSFFSDPDGDPLTFSIVDQPAGLTINPTTGVISGVPTQGGFDPVIQSVNFNMNTLRNVAPGNGVSALESDNWPITLAADGHQYTSFGDGVGFGNLSGFQNTRGSFGFSRIEGSTSNNYSAFDVFKSGENMPTSEQGKCYGMLGANGKLYAAVDYYLVGGNGSREDRYVGVSVTSSADFGASWTEDIRWDSGDWGGGNAGFYSMSFVQYGQDHSGARSPKTDPAYIYAAIMENSDGTYQVQIPGGIGLMRVLETDIESGNKADWEYLSGIDGNNDPSWSTVITNRINHFLDSQDGNDSSSISYNEPLGRYILTVMQVQREVPGSVIGFYDAPEPWGPWNTIRKENVQVVGPNLATGGAVIFWNFSNKWLSQDGLSFTFVGTLTGQDEWGTVEGTFTFG